jgi:Lar family restriction alleviation protein
MEEKSVPLPCPFCGSTDTECGEYADFRGPFFCLECIPCSASGPTARSSDEALRLWNNRCPVSSD